MLQNVLNPTIQLAPQLSVFATGVSGMKLWFNEAVSSTVISFFGADDVECGVDLQLCS